MQNKISVALITKNEENYLARCLESVKWADEIVLLDGFSTDRTIEIAKTFDVKIFQKEFESFPKERQYILEKTTYDWVLSIDADMIVPPQLGKEIRKVIREEPGYDAYKMRCLNHFLGIEVRHCSWFNYRFLRLFDKTKGHYDLSLMVLDPFICEGTVGKLENYLVHHQTESLEEYLKKMTALFTPLTADEYIDKGIEMKKVNIPWYLLLKPTLVFFHKYIIEKGFLDGLPGLIICLNSAVLYYFIYSVIWDRQKGIPEYNLEKYS